MEVEGEEEEGFHLKLVQVEDGSSAVQLTGHLLLMALEGDTLADKVEVRQGRRWRKWNERGGAIGQGRQGR